MTLDCGTRSVRDCGVLVLSVGIWDNEANDYIGNILVGTALMGGAVR